MATYAMHEAKLEVNTGTIAVPVLTEVIDVESADDSVDVTKVDWTSLDTAGWRKTILTGKSVTLSMAGKRNIGDTGNDYIDSIGKGDVALGNNQSITITFPAQEGDSIGEKYEIPCAIEVTKSIGGGSTDLGALEWDAISYGKPIVTPAVPV